VGESALAGPIELRDGDRIRFGGVRARFCVSPPDRPTLSRLNVSD
jgi:hypothetical protein